MAPENAAKLQSVLDSIAGPLAEKYRVAAVLRGGRIDLLDTKKGDQVCGRVIIDILGHPRIEPVMLGRRTLMGSVIEGDIRRWIAAGTPKPKGN